MQREHNVCRLVVKVGTSTLTRETGSLNLQNMERLARVLSDLEGMGYQVVLVSSGAIGIGTKKLRLDARPTELRMKQATAAVGQCMIFNSGIRTERYFDDFGFSVRISTEIDDL